MYPAQTSFIPVQVALARFLASGGWRAVFSRYPYWYLGTTPFRYLTGPILPSVLVFLHHFLPKISFFNLIFLLIALAWAFGALGVYRLVFSLAHSSASGKGFANRKAAVGGASLARLAAFFYFLGPLAAFFFPFSNGLNLISFSFLPYIFWGYMKFLKHKSRKREIFLCLLISFVILLDSNIISSLLLGMAAVFLATGGWKKTEAKLKRSFLLLAFSFLLISFWYPPGYWWQILISPSFGGQSLYRVIGRLAQLLPSGLAVCFAIFSARTIKIKNRALKFCFYWLFVFGFLTFVRFLSDPDFWLDWSAYHLELQLGAAIVLAWLMEKRRKISGAKGKSPEVSIGLHLRGVGFLLVYFCLFAFIFKGRVLGTLQKNISRSVEYRLGRFLAQRVKPGETVFLSGSDVFWLNAFFDVSQVRGGADPVSVQPNWRKAAWEIREGEEVQKSMRWLRELKVSYLVVHTSQSKEYYHDFKHPEKFERAAGLRKIYDFGGDRIYSVENGSGFDKLKRERR